MKLIVPNSHYSPEQQDMLNRLRALREAVKGGDVAQMVTGALFEKDQQQQIIVSGTCLPSAFPLFALSLLNQVEPCCRDLNCPRYREMRVAHVALSKLAGVDGQQQVIHGASQAKPKLTAVNGGA